MSINTVKSREQVLIFYVEIQCMIRRVTCKRCMLKQPELDDLSGVHHWHDAVYEALL